MTSGFNEQIDQCLISLKVIGMIQKNDKLCVRKGSLTIEPNDKFQIMRRWFYKDNRFLCMMHIRNTITTTNNISKSIIEGKIDINMSNWTLKSILKELTNCQSGMINLKTTYSNDTVMIANIDMLLERIQANCDELYLVLSQKIDGFDQPVPRILSQ